MISFLFNKILSDLRSVSLQLSQWWVQVAYLDFRMPVVVHSSPGLVLPRMDFRDQQGQIR